MLLEEASVQAAGGRVLVRVRYRAPAGVSALELPHYVGVSVQGARVSEQPPELISDTARGWLAEVAALRKRPDLLMQEWEELIDQMVALRKRPDLLMQEWDALLDQSIALRKRPDLLTQEWDTLIDQAIELLASPPRRAHWKAEISAVMDEELGLQRGGPDPLAAQWDQLIEQSLRLRKRPDLLMQEWDELIEQSFALRRKADASLEWSALAEDAIRLFKKQVTLAAERDELIAQSLAFATRMDGLPEQWQVLAARPRGEVQPVSAQGGKTGGDNLQKEPPVIVDVSLEVDAQVPQKGLTGKVGVYDAWGRLETSAPLQPVRR